MNLKNKLLASLSIVLLLTGVFSLQAQDPGFSQFYGNPVYLNPALAGNKICPRITLNYRNQWPSIPASFVTYAATYDQYVDFLSGGVALMVVSDQAGDGIYQNNSASGVYNYRLEASSSIVINAGFQATYQQMSIDWNRLVFADQLLNGGGTSEIQPGLNKSLVDFSAGILAGYRESAYIGFAAHHLTQPDNGFFPNSGSKQLMKMTVHAGALFNLESGGLFDGDEQSLSLSPNLLYMKQGDFQQLNAGVYLNMYPFVGGLWFRYNFDNADAAIALLGFQFNQFKIGYTYDYTVSKLTNATGGAHEVSVAWQFGCPEKREKIKAIKCPSF